MEFIPGCTETQVASGLYCPSGVGTAYVLEPLASGVWCLLQVEGLKGTTLPFATLFCVIFETGSHFLYQAGLEIFESTFGLKKKIIYFETGWGKGCLKLYPKLVRN